MVGREAIGHPIVSDFFLDRPQHRKGEVPSMIRCKKIAFRRR
jgi:hypothetical protein